jgi:PKD repeat protein
VPAATAQPASQRSPTTVAFSPGRSGGVAYAWNFGDGTAVSHSARPQHTYASAGHYTTTLTVTYANGSTSVTHTSVQVR